VLRITLNRFDVALYCSSMADLVVTGRVAVDGSWGRREVVVEGGKIVSVAEVGGSDAARTGRRLDVGDAYVLPGMVDAHVHCRSGSAEGVASATAAAAAGGVTTIVEMPFDYTGPINSLERFTRKRELVEAEAVVDVALLATVEPGGGWRSVDELVDAGACGFKVSLFGTDECRFPRIGDAELLDVFSAVAAAGTVVCVHAERDELIKDLIAACVASSDVAPTAHARSRPPVSETLAVLDALEVAASTGARLHLCHLSTPRSVDLAGWFRGAGTDVSTETCAHYLLLTEEDVAEQGSRLKINPPLRSEEYRQGLWERVGSSAVDVIASDHAPWPMGLKSHEAVFDNHSGVPGVETVYPLVLGAAGELGPAVFAEAIAAMTSRPAARFGFGGRKGAIEPGFDADLVVFDPEAAWVVDETASHSNAGWSPYHARHVKGRIRYTICRGQVVWDGETVAPPGSGRWLPVLPSVTTSSGGG